MNKRGPKPKGNSAMAGGDRVAHISSSSSSSPLSSPRSPPQQDLIIPKDGYLDTFEGEVTQFMSIDSDSSQSIKDPELSQIPNKSTHEEVSVIATGLDSSLGESNSSTLGDELLDDALSLDSEALSPILQSLCTSVIPLSPDNRFFCDVTLSAFIQTLAWYPVVIPIDALEAGVYRNIANIGIEDNVSDELLSKSFLYNTIFAHGSRLIGNEQAASEFINKAFYLLNGLFLKKGITKAKEAEILLQGLIFFIPFVIGNQIERARTCIVHAFTLWNSFSEVLSISLICRVYIHMLEVSSHIVDRHYWFQMVTKLGNKALTKENRALLSYISVFSPKAEMIYNRDNTAQLDLIGAHINAIVQFLESSETWLKQQQQQPPPQTQPPQSLNLVDATKTEEEFLSDLYAYRSIISSSKCYIYQCLDNLPLAVNCAFEAISLAVQTTVPHLPVLIILAHVIRFLLESAKDIALNSPIFYSGIHKIRSEITYALNSPYISPENHLPPNQFTKSDLHHVHILCAVHSPLSLFIMEPSSPTDYIPSVPMDPLFCCDLIEELSNEVIMSNTC